jgi:hypothetical protein
MPELTLEQCHTRLKEFDPEFFSTNPMPTDVETLELFVHTQGWGWAGISKPFLHHRDIHKWAEHEPAWMEWSVGAWGETAQLAMARAIVYALERTPDSEREDGVQDAP